MRWMKEGSAAVESCLWRRRVGEPFVVTPVSRGGRVPIARFGQLLSIESGTMVLAIKQADDGFGIIVFLQEVTGLSRTIRIRPDLVQFEYAHLVDLAERDRGDSLEVTGDGVQIPVTRFGVTAVRLSQLRLRTAG